MIAVKFAWSSLVSIARKATENRSARVAAPTIDPNWPAAEAIDGFSTASDLAIPHQA